MCQVAYHNCPECGEEIKCQVPDRDCEWLNGYNGPCAKCEWWIEEERQEHEKYERMMLERQRYEQDLWEAERNKR